MFDPFVSNVPWDLVATVRTRFDLRNFIETGTSNGQSASMASAGFGVVCTIEVDPDRYKVASKRLRQYRNVRCFCGSSVDILPTLLRGFTTNSLFWLDAHWDGHDGCFGPQCPLLEELAILLPRKQDVLLIDDARLFLHAPPEPLDPKQWPTVKQIVETVRCLNDTAAIQLVGDVICITPEPLFEDLKCRAIPAKPTNVRFSPSAPKTTRDGSSISTPTTVQTSSVPREPTCSGRATA